MGKIKVLSGFISNFQVGHQYRFSRKGFTNSFTERYNRGSSGIYEPDQKKIDISKAEILTCHNIVEDKPDPHVFTIRFAEIEGNYWWDVRDFEEVTMDNSEEDKMEIKLEDCQKDSLLEAKHQFENERHTQEVDYAVSQLRQIQDRIDSLTRDITRLDKERKELQEKLKQFFGVAK